jgi:hypothetical protein
MKKDEELHEQIMQAFREYFKANQDWVNKGTRRAGMDTRTILNKIKHLAIERRKHIMEWRYDLDADKFERKKAKNQKGNPENK